MKRLSTAILILITALCIQGCNSAEQHQASHRGHSDHGHEDHHEEVEKGEHGGRLFKKDDFAVELKIFETGVPPRYRLYAYKNEKSLVAQDLKAKVIIKRLAESPEEFILSPVDDFLTSEQEVGEPHSFDVSIIVEYAQQTYEWSFTSEEARTDISDQQAQNSGIVTEKAEAREIRTTIRANGKILPSEHKIAHIIPRFPGVVKEGRKHIGDFVQKGEVLAVIESNQSLQPFEVKSQIAGQVINGHLILGEYVPENQWVYVVADLSEVWVDFFMPLSEKSLTKIGQSVTISSLSTGLSVEGKVSYIAPYADEKSQSQLIRVVVPNSKQEFLPGMFVVGDLVTSEHLAQVVVKKSALQTFRDWQVVFIKSDESYEARPLKLGRSDGEWVEVLEGLKVGQEYVAENSFLIKADILKSAASHDH